MRTSRDWEKPVRRMELLLRLRSFPVAFKLLENKEALAEVPFLRRMTHKVTLCQMITLVRTYDWTVGARSPRLSFSHVSFDHRPDRACRKFTGTAPSGRLFGRRPAKTA